ncbi:MAG TPA: hypothetical protein VME43_26190 [Bryobacteraceae bacterium]|nr:hypothetical protein [Bryobacteraceae bacterium]
MLKITIYPSAMETRLRLEGKLAGPWVGELRQAWLQCGRAEAGPEGHATVLDLREVDFVDPEGQALLTEMHGRGVRLEASCPLIQHLVEEIAGGCECATVEGKSAGRRDAIDSSNPARRHARSV